MARQLGLLVVAIAWAGCVKRAPDGTVLRRIPKCESQGRAVRAKPLEEAVQSCMRLLSLDPVDSSRTLLGLSTDENGKVSTVCVVGSTHDDDSRFLNCVADQLLTVTAMPANQQHLVWTLNVSF